MKGLLFDALRYQETLDPTRPAIFQTVSLGTWVNKGKKRKGPGQDSTGPHGALLPRSRTPLFSEVAELARLEPVQHQLEGLGANSSGAGEGMVHGGYGEQNQRDHPS